ELAGDADAAAAFDLPFDRDVRGDQRFLAGNARFGARRRSAGGNGSELGFGRSVEANRFPGFRGGRRVRAGGGIVFPDGHGGTYPEDERSRLALNAGRGNCFVAL